MFSRLRALPATLAFCALIAPAGLQAQGAPVSFSGVKVDTAQPIEVTADQLSVNQNDGQAVFTGNVIVIQGEMRLTAPEVQVKYLQGAAGKIERITALGGVTLVSANEAAEGREAVYTVADDTVVMTGDVLLTQTGNTVAGDRLTVNIKEGTGRMEGRVRTVLQTGQP